MATNEERKNKQGNKCCMKIIYKSLGVLHYKVTYVLILINISTLRNLEVV
jgi:hypothetical protein